MNRRERWRIQSGIALLALALGLIWGLNLFPGRPCEGAEGPEVSADGAVLMEGATGDLLYAKNPHKVRPPASTTKIMTARLALERDNLRRLIKVSPAAARVGESSIYLEPGEILTVEDLVYGAMLKSGNDACVALAEDLAGDERAFALRMTWQAKLLGAWQTTFYNSNGLPAKGHLTTAHDLAQITRWAMAHEDFARIVQTREKVIPWYGKSWSRYLKNTNKFLWQYPWADGVKTGTTREAGQCLVASATRDGRRLIVVLLHSQARFQEARELLEYGFSSFEFRPFLSRGEEFIKLPVAGGQGSGVPVVAREDLVLVLPRGAGSHLQKIVRLNFQPRAPLTKGTRLGSVTLLLDGKVVRSVDLVAGKTVPRETWLDKARKQLESW